MEVDRIAKTDEKLLEPHHVISGYVRIRKGFHEATVARS
jgi:hypothetical protein